MKRLDLNSPFPGPVLYTAETGSTMDEARGYTRKRRGESLHGTVIVAGHQREGRGRLRSRRWESAPGESLLATLVLDVQQRFPGSSLSIRLALAVSRYLEERYGLEPEIKWPNDVLIAGRKISGILCESAGELFFGGIGLNCRQDLQKGGRDEAGGVFVREEWSVPPTSIYSETGLRPDPLEELPPLLESVAKVLDMKDIREVQSYLYKRGERMRLVEGHPDTGTLLEGSPEAVSREGALLFRRESDGEILRLFSGEFSSR